MVQLVGVLNVTPDSFSDGGWFFRPMAAVHHAQQLFEDGAGLVDVGAESTRPNAQPLNAEKEWSRLESVLRPLLQKYPGKISLDSYHPETVRRALQLGPVIVNDVTGLQNPEMVRVVLELKPTVIMSHLPGHDIQQAHQQTPITSVGQVKDDLLRQAANLEKGGLPHENIILDPGIGFGKTTEVNRQLLEFAKLVPRYPVMIGYSRKRFLGEHRMELAPNLEAGRTAIRAGAAYLRVHDVAGHRPLLSEPHL